MLRVQGVGFRDEGFHLEAVGSWAARHVKAKFPPKDHPVVTLPEFRVLFSGYGCPFSLGSRCVEDLWTAQQMRL